jgi:hypothetical protein
LLETSIPSLEAEVNYSNSQVKNEETTFTQNKENSNNQTGHMNNPCQYRNLIKFPPPFVNHIRSIYEK